MPNRRPVAFWSTAKCCRATCRARLAAHGVAMVPEGSGVFPGLTVQEIFALGMWSAGVAEAERAERVEWVMQVLPPVRAFL